MDFHEDLKLPAEAIAQIADDTRNARADLAPGSAETPVSSVTSRVRSSGTFPRVRCPAVTVTLDAGGAGTYTQRAIPGPEPSRDWCTFRPPPPVRTLQPALSSRYRSGLYDQNSSDA
jgi:hypothetical protein